MHFVYPLSRLSKREVRLAGGKGASLGEMTQAGIPVPPGFVISSHAFDTFLDQNRIRQKIRQILHQTRPNHLKSIQKASQQIRAHILHPTIPSEISKEILTHFRKLKSSYVAVRSSATAEDSATAAWAGQLETYLNTTKKDLLHNVKQCWASLYTPRALTYQHLKGSSEPVSVASLSRK